MNIIALLSNFPSPNRWFWCIGDWETTSVYWRQKGSEWIDRFSYFSKKVSETGNRNGQTLTGAFHLISGFFMEQPNFIAFSLSIKWLEVLHFWQLHCFNWILPCMVWIIRWLYYFQLLHFVFWIGFLFAIMEEVPPNLYNVCTDQIGFFYRKIYKNHLFWWLLMLNVHFNYYHGLGIV